MCKAAWVTVAVLALLLTGIVPAEDVCGLEASMDHACCAEMQREPVPSCCSGSETDAVSTHASQNLDCTCVHPPSATFAVSFSSPSGHDGDPTWTVADESRSDELSVPDAHRSVERRIRSHPPPPVFLLDCAFLI